MKSAQVVLSTPHPGEQLHQTDEELVRRFKDGEEQAFNEIVRRFQERIFNLVFRLLQDFDEAHDIAQETFIRAHDKLKGFRGESTPYTWLYRIALNLSLNHMRKKKLRAFFSLDSMATQDLAAAGGPERDLDAAELRTQVDAAVGRLPGRQRSIFILRQYDRLSHREIAEVLGCSEGSVRAGYFHAVKKLQAALKDWL